LINKIYKKFYQNRKIKHKTKNKNTKTQNKNKNKMAQRAILNVLNMLSPLSADERANSEEYRAYGRTFDGYTLDLREFLEGEFQYRGSQLEAYEERLKLFRVATEYFKCSACKRAESVMGISLHKFTLDCGHDICGNCMQRVVVKMDYTRGQVGSIQNGKLWCPTCASQGTNPTAKKMYIFATLKGAEARGDNVYQFASGNETVDITYDSPNNCKPVYGKW
jgi:hypothetical protein